MYPNGKVVERVDGGVVLSVGSAQHERSVSEVAETWMAEKVPAICAFCFK